MVIIIPDDYQDIVDRLSCFSLLAGHKVVRYREPAAHLDQLVERLRPAEIVVAIRERVTFSRTLIERLPNLKLIALVGRAAATIDYQACKDHGVLVSTGVSNSPTSPAELTLALIVASRRNIALEAERMRRGDWPCTLSHRLRGSTLGIFGLGAIGTIVARAGEGMGMNVLVWGQRHVSREGLCRRLRFRCQQGRSVRAFRRFDAARPAASRHTRHRWAGRSGAHEAYRAAGQYVPRRPDPTRCVAGGVARRPSGYAAVDVYDEEPIIGGNHPFLSMDNVLCTPHLGWAEWDNFELYFRECFEQIVAYAKGAPMRLVGTE